MEHERAELHHVPETRFRSFDDAECRMEGGSNGFVFRGYASVFDSPYTIHDQWGDYQETVTRSAFDSTLAQDADVVFLLNHEGAPYARTKSGTLKLRTDSKGLIAEAHLDPTSQRAQDLKSMVDRQDLDEMSFTFRDLRPNWNAAYTERSLREVSLHHGDTALVNFGANPATKGLVSMRAMLTTKQANDLPDSAFAYIEPGGTKDSEGKTVPRTKRHYPIHDAAHVRNALSRASQAIASGGTAAAIAAKAMPKIKAAAKKFGIGTAESKSLGILSYDRWAKARIAELRAPLHARMSGTHSHRHSAHGSQGRDRTHEHEHTHSDDNLHDHHGDGAANANVSSADSEDDDSTMATASSLGLKDYSVEARIAILKAKGREWDWTRPLTDAERWALDVARREQEAAKRAAARRRKRAADFYGKWVP